MDAFEKIEEEGMVYKIAYYIERENGWDYSIVKTKGLLSDSSRCTVFGPFFTLREAKKELREMVKSDIEDVKRALIGLSDLKAEDVPVREED